MKKRDRAARRARALVAVCGIFLSCSPPPDIDDGDYTNRPDGGAPSGDGGGGGAAGLPCEVSALLSSRCTGCHRQPPAGGAPMALLTYEDLARGSSVMAGQSVAQRALARMGDATRPMPPGAGPSVTAQELGAFRAWVEAGLPRGTCGGGDMGPDPFASPPTCTSGQYWDDDDDDDDVAGWRTPQKDGSPRMNPGRACIACHRRDDDAPRLFAGGTVYPTAHEPDLCLGFEGATVEVTDALGVVRQSTTNRSGNFLFYSGGLQLPLRARVLYQGRERRMNGAQMSGDCNGCHTQNGASGAPGRIVLP